MDRRAVASAILLMLFAGTVAIPPAEAAPVTGPAKATRGATRDVMFTPAAQCDLVTAQALSSRHPDVRQLVIVAAGTWTTTTATLQIVARSANGTWRCQQAPVVARLGKSGSRPLAERRSGDGTTPAGSFPLGSVRAWDGQQFQFFGNQPDPGVRGSYRLVRNEDCWGATPNTASYQALVNDPGCTSPDEWLTRIGDVYGHAAVIGANLDPISGNAPGETPFAAAIFLHRNSYTAAGASKPTSGCVSLAEDDLELAVRLIDPALSVQFAIGELFLVAQFRLALLVHSTTATSVTNVTALGTTGGTMPLSTMQDYPLTIRPILEHGRTIHANSKVITFTGDGYVESTFAEVADRADQLAAALTRLGVQPGDRIGTFMWNNQTHLEAYLAVPCMGAVLHTLNIRLFPEQLSYVINHAEDQVIIVDASIIPLLAKVRDQLTTVKHIIVKGAGDTSALGDTLDYDTLLDAEQPGFDYPDVDERSGMAMCYTSGTTGNPKGVMYSHRSTFLHSLMVTSTANIALAENDRMLVIVPMFHANAWGTPYAAWMVGADLVFPQQFLQCVPLARIIEETRPTLTGAVPTVLTDLLMNGKAADLSSLRLVMCGGSAVPRALIQGYLDVFDVPIVQGWGMTETSPVCAIGHPPKDMGGDDEVTWRTRTGRVLPGVELRITDDSGATVPWDGESLGEIEVRGPWITASYYRVDDPDKFHDGWLRTGDVASVSSNGYVMISDRAKDVIKSGGEWVSSVDLENTLMGHPDIAEAAVIGVPDERWDERPLACVVRKADSQVTAAELCGWLADRTAKLCLPERWAFIDEVPKTSVGKFDKKVLRARHAADQLEVEKLR